MDEMLGAPSNPEQANAYLRVFLQEHSSFLKQILRVYVLRMGLVSGENVRLVTEEVFQDAVVQIMAHRERFLTVQEPRAWFLAVAGNILKRKRTSLARRERFEVLSSELALSKQMSEADLFEQLVDGVASPEQMLLSREGALELLALVSPSDAQVLRLAILADLDSSAVARELGISLEAARVRLHRALRRLAERFAQLRSREDESR